MSVLRKILPGIYIGVTFLILGCKSFYRKYYTDPDACFSAAKCRPPYDVIIVPGYPHKPGNVDPLVKCRVYWATYLYKQGIARNIIFSGSAVYTPYVESVAMAMYAQGLGIPEENIFVETQAEHSTENLYFSCKLAEEKGFKSIALATDPAQSSFLKSMQSKFGINIDYLPVVSDTLDTMFMIDPVIDDGKARAENFVSLPDREGLYKRLKGTRGHRIKLLIREEKEALEKSLRSRQ